MVKPKAINLTGLAKDVWKGMSEGVNNGRKFVVKNNEQAIKAQKKLNRETKLLNKGYKMTVDPKKLKSDRKALSKRTALHSKVSKPNMAQKTGNFVGGGIRDTYKNMEKGDNFTKALKEAHSKSNGQLDMKKVAGTYVGASAVARVATGGGVMKDKNGNTNLIGIPFI